MKHKIASFGQIFEFEDSNNKGVGSYDYIIKGLKESSWEHDTFSLINHFKNKEGTLLDIGAWIGPISMFASNLFKNVIAIEADKVAIDAFKKNLATKSNIQLIEKAIVHNDYQDKHVYFGSNKTGKKEDLGNSKSQHREEKFHDNDYKVPIIKINEIKDLDENITFIKCDIEGGEEFLIPDLFDFCKNKNIVLWMSFHYTWWTEKSLKDYEDYFNSANQIIYFNGVEFPITKGLSSLESIVSQSPFHTVLFTF